MSNTLSPKTRRDSITNEFKEIVNKGLDEFHSKSKLQLGQHVIGRMLSLCSVKLGKKVIFQTDASNQVAREIINNWISKNVYPLSEKNVAKKIKEDYAHFKVLLKKYRNENYKKLMSRIEKLVI